jgi:alpha/beta superfamily hydrolase
MSINALVIGAKLHRPKPIMEKPVSFRSGNVTLEGAFAERSLRQGVIVTHPHPLYGGDMGNPVVESIVDTYGRKGYSTLRFNFRGVGRSEGIYGEGIDEQQDILSAIDYCLQRGIQELHLAGYSFGSWVVAHTEQLPEQVNAIVLVSPPLALMPFKTELHLKSLRLVITGEEDEIAPPKLIEAALPNWNQKSSYKVVDNADHFFFGFFPALEAELQTFLSQS